jgi:3-oxoacyl-[acyl-carrier protein] reductase
MPFLDSLSSFALAGRVALLTGAGTGIGQASAILLAQAGATVAVHYHNSATGAEKTLAEIQRHHGQGFLVQADLTDEMQTKSLIEQVISQAGRLDVLFNNAGSVIERAKLEDCSLDLWRRVMDANLTSAFLTAREAIPHLKKSGYGSIINNLSLSVQTGGSGGAGPYAAAKGGLMVMTRTLAKELAPLVRVNSIMPGVVETPHHEAFSTPEKMEDYRRLTPLARNATAEEIARTVLYLASDASSFMTGAVLDLNGGRFLR